MTPEQIQARLDQYLACETKILKNQSYTIGTRTYTRANLSHIQKGIKELEQALASALNGGTIRIRKALFRDD